MKRENMLKWALVGLVVYSSGCVSYDEHGNARFGVTRREPSTPPPTQQRVIPQQLVETQRDSRIADLERQVRQLQHELESMGASINTISQKANAVETRGTAQGADVNALRSEVAGMRRELDVQNASIKAIPGTMSKLFEENNRMLLADVDGRVKTAVAAVASKRSSTSSTARANRPSSGKFYEHEVAAGQTLSVIAHEYGVSMEEIMRENNIKNASLIRVGQKLLIPVK